MEVGSSYGREYLEFSFRHQERGPMCNLSGLQEFFTSTDLRWRSMRLHQFEKLMNGLILNQGIYQKVYLHRYTRLSSKFI